MSAFHPAVTGILYSALAQHEQSLFQMAIAANISPLEVDDETADRYAAIVDGLKRMIALAEPPRYGTSAFEASEQFRRSYDLLGRLMSQLPEFDIWSWDLRGGEIDASLRSGPGGKDAVRTNMRTIADRLGIEYSDGRHGKTGTQLMVRAKGTIDGVSIRIYDLIEAERPICDAHHVMVDALGVCPQCPVADAESPLLAELRVVHASRPFGAYAQACAFCSDGQGVPVPWPCTDLRYAEVEFGGPEVRAEVRRRHFGRKDPEHGRVCAGCSEERGVSVLWPCLLLRTVDRIEDVPHADSGLLQTSPPDSTEAADIDAVERDLGYPDGELSKCAVCRGWHRQPWCADPSEDAVAAGVHEGRFTDAQLDGTACSECGGDFAEGATAVPTGLVIDGGQLFAHSDCLTDSTTETPGEAP